MLPRCLGTTSVSYNPQLEESVEPAPTSRNLQPQSGPGNHLLTQRLHIYSIPAPSKGSPMEAPTLLRDLHWTPLEGPGTVYIYIYLTRIVPTVPYKKKTTTQIAMSDAQGEFRPQKGTSLRDAQEAASIPGPADLLIWAGKKDIPYARAFTQFEKANIIL